MRRLIILVVMGLLFALVPATAQASQSTWTEKHCIKTDVPFTEAQSDPEVCMRVGWKGQADGTGMRLEDAWVWFRKGCSGLGHPINKGVTISATGNTWTRYEIFRSRDKCTVHYNLETNVSGNAVKSRINFWTRINVANWPDRTLHSRFYICKFDLC
jgi:hypothetical protein